MSAPPAASELVSEPNPFVYQYSIQRHSDGAIIGEVSTLPGVNLDDGMAAATPRNSITSASASTFEDDLERGLIDEKKTMRNVGFVESKMDTLGRWSESWPNRFMVFCLLFVILFWLHYEDTHMHAVAHGTEKVEQPERM